MPDAADATAANCSRMLERRRSVAASGVGLPSGRRDDVFVPAGLRAGHLHYRARVLLFKRPMLARDFFSYCTGLKLLELKAIGELSHVRHLEEGETIYSTGDPCDALFIINRGVVEVIQPSAQKSAPAAYLSRGDMLGEVETLSGLPRKHVARTQEPVSPVFPAQGFPGIDPPGAVVFPLSQHPTRRACHPGARPRDHPKPLPRAGREPCEFRPHHRLPDHLEFFPNRSAPDLERELRIDLDFLLRARPAPLRPVRASHWRRSVLAAFRQRTTRGHLCIFFDCTGADPIERITKNASELLINALQGRDEFAELKQRFADPEATLQRHKTTLSWPADAPQESEQVAQQIWQFVESGPVTVSAIFRHCAVCEMKVYQVVDELLRSHHFVWSQDAVNAKVA